MKRSAPRKSKQPTSADGRLKILFISSECTPFAKTGGLGDVVGALPKTLHDLGHDVRILIPLYASIDRIKYNIQFDSSSCIHMGNREEQWVGVHSTLLDGKVPVWFVDCERFYGRPGIYHDRSGEYLDNAYRFALLSKAALQICKDKKFIPHIMHVHDWCTSLTSAFLKTWDRIASPLSNTASVLTIHNIGYQGNFHTSAYGYIGVGNEHFTSEKFEDHGKLNLLKAGIAFSDAITTVSRTHAEEILTPIGGCGLAPYLNNRRTDLFGILNGVDYEHWNPETDKLIPSRYSQGNMQGKSICKAALQSKFKLEVNAKIPVFGIVSRFASQKGFSLVAEALPRALDRMAFQVAVIGSGDRATENFFNGLQTVYRSRVGTYIGYSDELSHLIESGSDFFLMPSLYEPCGLNQMYSLRYGTLPIVRATGGLNDTVQNYDEKTGDGTGFKFLLPTAQALYDTIGWAVSTWFDRPHHIKQMQQKAMDQRFLWKDSAEEYLQVYEHAMKKRLQ